MTIVDRDSNKVDNPSERLYKLIPVPGKEIKIKFENFTIKFLNEKGRGRDNKINNNNGTGNKK